MLALDAVKATVKIPEEDPTFNAGRGAFLNAVGEIELDAIICDGRTLDFGAVAAIQIILHSVSAARLVLEKSEHYLVVGRGTMAFLRNQGIQEVPIEELLTEWERDFYIKIKNDPNFTTREPFEPYPKVTVDVL